MIAMDILFIVVGALIGSFLSVCIYRIPLARMAGEEVSEEEAAEANPDDLIEVEVPDSIDIETLSIAYPRRSFCPSCGAQLLWWHNIPLLSWFLLRGKCHFCKKKISFRYPAVEMLSALFCWGSFVHYGLSPTAFIVYAFSAALIVISFIDIDYFIIPNVISLPGTALGFAVAGINHYTHWFAEPVVQRFPSALWGVLAGAGFLWVVAELYLKLRKKEGLGMGDVKLLAMTGAFFGPEAALYTIFVGSLAGSALGVLLIIFSSRKFSQHLPFGPYLALGTVLYLFSGSRFLYLVGDAVSGVIRLFL